MDGYGKGSWIRITQEGKVMSIYKEYFSDIKKQKSTTLEEAERVSALLEKNIPTSPGKWARAKAAARAKFKVYPSAYANLWAAKKYKSMGGGWKKGKK